MSQFVCINKSTYLESTQPHKVVLLCVYVYVCVCFFLFVKRSTYNCRPLQKYKINTCVSTSHHVHLDVRIIKMAGSQVDALGVDSTSGPSHCYTLGWFSLDLDVLGEDQWAGQ